MHSPEALLRRSWSVRAGVGILSGMTNLCPTSVPPRRSLGDGVTSRRWIGVLVACLSGGLLLVAAWLDPSPNGHGTHTQLGMMPCGWVMHAGIPCPSCGMTTAFAHAADGDMLGSLRAQPAGAVLAFLTAGVLVISIWQAVSGARLAGFWMDHLGKWFFITFGVIVIMAWVYKILEMKELL